MKFSKRGFRASLMEKGPLFSESVAMKRTVPYRMFTRIGSDHWFRIARLLPDRLIWNLRKWCYFHRRQGGEHIDPDADLNRIGTTIAPEKVWSTTARESMDSIASSEVSSVDNNGGEKWVRPIYRFRKKSTFGYHISGFPTTSPSSRIRVDLSILQSDIA